MNTFNKRHSKISSTKTQFVQNMNCTKSDFDYFMCYFVHNQEQNMPK